MRQLLILLLAVNTLSCGSNDEPAIIGVWKTNDCDQTKLASNSLAETWSKGIYDFTGIGTIVFNSELYQDSQCTVKAEEQNTKNYWPSASFVDRGREITQEGINGYGIDISLGTLPGKAEYKSYYSLQDGNLCLSRTFRFDPNSDIILNIVSEAIDFEHCLSK